MGVAIYSNARPLYSIYMAQDAGSESRRVIRLSISNCMSLALAGVDEWHHQGRVVLY
jgi:hypothetical protein